MHRILLLLPTRSYKATEFLEAARALGCDTVVATDRRQALESESGDATVAVDFEAVDVAASIERLHAERPFSGIFGVDDETTLAAARMGATLGLDHNPPEAVAAARDKASFRQIQHRRGLPAPDFRLVGPEADLGAISRRIGHPVVLKPRAMSASRGVIRADDADAFVAAASRIRKLLERAGERRREVLVETYLDGSELALEGLLEAGELKLLALFDKPDPLNGPTFPETLYVMPARVPDETAGAARDAVQLAARALGLRTGPVHAEIRFPTDRAPVVLELAPRTIGGRCGRSLRFPGDRGLAEVVLAAGLGTAPAGPAEGAAGVLMLPVEREGVLETVEGVERARALPSIREVEITVHRGDELEPLPEGDRYLGFVFAEAETPDEVERALRAAGECIEVTLR